MNKPIQVIAVSGGKGGVGKSNCSVNIALAMAKKGKQVLLMDADLGLANIDILLGMRPTGTLANVLSGECELKDIIMEGPKGIKVIPASSGVKKMAALNIMENAGIIRAFSSIEDSFDVMIVDTAAGIADSVIAFSQASQHVVIVLCDEPASLADAYALIKVLNQNAGICRFQVIANMVRNEVQSRILFQRLQSVTDQFLGVQLHYLGMVPYDIYLKRAVQASSAVLDVFPSAPSSKAFVEIEQKISRLNTNDTVSGDLSFFFERFLTSGCHEEVV